MLTQWLRGLHGEERRRLCGRDGLEGQLRLDGCRGPVLLWRHGWDVVCCKSKDGLEGKVRKEKRNKKKKESCFGRNKKSKQTNSAEDAFHLSFQGPRSMVTFKKSLRVLW